MVMDGKRLLSIPPHQKKPDHVSHVDLEKESFLLLGLVHSIFFAPFTAMEFSKTLVRALGTYKSPLSLDRVVLVEMFEIGVNNTMHTNSLVQSRSLLYTPTATLCI